MDERERVMRLREQLDENPRKLIRYNPDEARDLADRARADGRDELADRIERLVDDVMAEPTAD